ncbi:hypothetical protein MP228_006847 [Amoeboaphelidium protococcarum]|nr:hypothetical protein MP228_006847 [Amoeboaphelidium protococcarum]
MLRLSHINLQLLRAQRLPQVIPICLPTVCNGPVHVLFIKITRLVSALAKHSSDGNQDFVTRAEFIESQNSLIQYLDSKFAYVDNKLTSVNNKFESVDEKLVSLDQKFDEVKQETRQIRKDLDVVKNLNANISSQLGGNFQKFSIQ